MAAPSLSAVQAEYGGNPVPCAWPKLRTVQIEYRGNPVPACLPRPRSLQVEYRGNQVPACLPRPKSLQVEYFFSPTITYTLSHSGSVFLVHQAVPVDQAHQSSVLTFTPVSSFVPPARGLFVRIQPPVSSDDERVSAVRIYKHATDTSPARLIAEVAIGTDEFVDEHATFGSSYYCTFFDGASGHESPASPLTRIFRQRDTAPFIAPLAYQTPWVLQERELDVARIAASEFPLLVTDYSTTRTDAGARTQAEVSRLRSNGRSVLAYVSLGMAEADRFYSPFFFDVEDRPLLHAQNPRDSRQYLVEYWQPLWSEKMRAYIDRVIAAGFSGVFFDHLSAYAPLVGINSDSFADMRTLFVDLVTYARGIDPDFQVIANRAEDFRNEPLFRALTDGIARNELYYFTHDLPRDANVNGSGLDLESKTSLQLEQELTQFRYLSGGKPVYTYDHTLVRANSQFVMDRTKSLAFKGYTTQDDHGVLRVVV